MSLQGNTDINRSGFSTHNVSFLVESMVLLVFLVGMLALFVNMFVGAYNQTQASVLHDKAISLAKSAAEAWSSHPQNSDVSAIHDETEPSLKAVAEVTSQTTEAGVLYHATITVINTSEPGELSDANSASAGEPGSAGEAGSTGEPGTAGDAGSADSTSTPNDSTSAPNAAQGKIICTLQTSRYVSTTVANNEKRLYDVSQNTASAQGGA